MDDRTPVIDRTPMIDLVEVDGPARVDGPSVGDRTASEAPVSVPMDGSMKTDGSVVGLVEDRLRAGLDINSSAIAMNVANWTRSRAAA